MSTGPGRDAPALVPFERDRKVYLFRDTPEHRLRGDLDAHSWSQLLEWADYAIDVRRGLVLKNVHGPNTAEADAALLA